MNFRNRTFFIIFTALLFSLLSSVALPIHAQTGDTLPTSSDQPRVGDGSFNAPCDLDHSNCQVGACIEVTDSARTGLGLCMECGERERGNPSSSLECGEGTTCQFGVCMKQGGNPDGANCRTDSNCASKNCGTFNFKCEAAFDSNGGGGTGGGFGNPDGKKLSEVAYSIEDIIKSFFTIVCNVVNIALSVVVIFIVYSGYLFMTAQGDPKQLETAKANFKTVLIGIAIIIGINVIMLTVATAVGVKDFMPFTC